MPFFLLFFNFNENLWVPEKFEIFIKAKQSNPHVLEPQTPGFPPLKQIENVAKK